MDIVFQSGEFINPDNSWITDFINTILGASIGSGVTVWALFRSFKQEKIKDEQKRIDFQREKLKYFQSMIRTILNDIRTQIENLNAFAIEIKKTPEDLPLLKQIPMNDLNRVVHKLNLEDYYHSYLSEFGDKQEIVDEFRDINSILNYFDSKFNLIQSSLNKSFEYDYERKVQLKNLVEKSMDETASYLINDEIVKKRNDFWNFLNNILLSFHRKSTENSNLKFYYDNFIYLMQKGLINFSIEIPPAHYLLIQMKQASFLYNDIRQQNLFVANDFEKWYKEMNEEYIKLVSKTKRLLEKTYI